jgi:HlyD family secretion protein
MKKYLILLIFGLCTVILCQQIPNITRQFSKECYTVPIISAEASESINCKGVILGNKNTGFTANIQISEDDILRVEEGQSVILHCNALGDTELKGKLTTLSDKAYQASYSTMKITVVDAVVDVLDDDTRLKSGYTVTAEIILNKIQDATILPFEAVAQENDGDYYVYRLENGWAYKEYIDVSFEDEKGAVVKNLDKSWQICENPAGFSKDSVRVKNDSDD